MAGDDSTWAMVNSYLLQTIYAKPCSPRQEILHEPFTLLSPLKCFDHASQELCRIKLDIGSFHAGSYGDAHDPVPRSDGAEATGGRAPNSGQGGLMGLIGDLRTPVAWDVKNFLTNVRTPGKGSI